jgi:hypothetical protein
VKAVLVTGETVVLPKGCDCRTHNEPHWVHMWRTDRDRTLAAIRPLLEKMDAIQAASTDGKVSFSAFIDYEQANLAVGSYAGDMTRIYSGALAEFKRFGIARLIEEESDQLYDLQLQTHRIQPAWASVLPVGPEITPYANKKSEVRMKAMSAL